LNTSNQRSFVQRLWDFFCSLKLTLFLLFTLAIASIIGTIIPQYPNIDERYWTTISSGKRALYESLGFFDMYHSWWFLAFLTLFSINLITCSIQRLPHVFKFISEPLLTLSESQQKSWSGDDINLTSTGEESKNRLAAFLTAEFATPVITKVEDQYHLFAQKNPWCRLGVYVVHFSILVIFAGAMIGNIFGYKGFVGIVEGDTVDHVELRNGKTIPLGFEVKCDQFSVTFYEMPGGGQSTMPKEFKSILTVTENGQEIPDYKHVRLIVNDPMTYKGITFYQSSYGQANNPDAFYFNVKDRNDDSSQQIVLRPGIPVELADGRKISIVDLSENPGEGLTAVLASEAKGSHQPNYFKVFKDHPSLDELRGDRFIFSLTGTNLKYYTGLQVNKDPGVWVVWIGCTLMCLGLCVAFFMSHKRIWIVLPDKGKARIYGNASKNQPSFKNEFEALTEKLNSQNI